MEEWKTFEVGDIVTRCNGGDEHEIIEVSEDWDLMNFKCITMPEGDWKFCEVGNTEWNVPWRYSLVRKGEQNVT